LFLICLAAPLQADNVKPIKALMLVGGCCHDYEAMPGVLTKADYQRLLADGILWFCNKSGDDGKPVSGCGGRRDSC
jgi:hypothetical protein